tara:strand:- start:2359 stop:2643 length:285 start_codon:yes stop_codon:yes gene_type:complete
MRHDAVNNLYGNVVNQVDDRAYDINGDLVDVDETKVSEEVKKLEADYDAKQYQRDRADAYPSYADQFDTIYHQGIDAWKAEIKKVKDAHPKPSA